MFDLRRNYLHLLVWFVSVMPIQAAWGDPIESFSEPFRKIDIAPAEPGTIATISVSEGDRIARGQVLATLDCDVLVIGLNAAAANRDAKGKINSAIAERDLRAMRLEKLRALRSRANASQDEVDRAQTDAHIAEANLLATREQHVLDEWEYKKTAALIERRTMRSPIDGVVTRIYREEREFVSTNNPAVLTIVQLDRLRVTFSVPTLAEPKLRTGQNVPIYFPETDEKAEAFVEHVAPITEAESGTVRVKVLLDNAEGKYRCGTRCMLDLHAIGTPPTL